MKGHTWHGREALLLCKASKERDPVVAMEKTAAALIDEAGLDRPPFRPEVLASYRDVREVRRTEMPGAARLQACAEGLVIEVNANHPLGRQNFSIDHEVAHTLLPGYEGRSIDDQVTGGFELRKEEEYLCDVGAAALLLDSRWLKPLALDIGVSLQSLFDLASLFEASLQATALQLSRLNIWPCAFVFWEEGLRKAESVSSSQGLLPGMEEIGAPNAKLRVASAYTSTSFGHYIPRNKSVSNSSHLVDCYRTGEPRAGAEVIDTGNELIHTYCEAVYAPYRCGPTTRQRVISLLLPLGLPSPRLDLSSINYQLEML